MRPWRPLSAVAYREQRRPDASAALHDIYTPGRPAYRRSSLSRNYSSESRPCAQWRLTALHCLLVLMRLLLYVTYIPRTVLRTADRPFPEATVALIDSNSAALSSCPDASAALCNIYTPGRLHSVLCADHPFLDAHNDRSPRLRFWLLALDISRPGRAYGCAVEFVLMRLFFCATYTPDRLHSVLCADRPFLDTQ